MLLSAGGASCPLCALPIRTAGGPRSTACRCERPAGHSVDDLSRVPLVRSTDAAPAQTGTGTEALKKLGPPALGREQAGPVRILQHPTREVKAGRLTRP